MDRKESSSGAPKKMLGIKSMKVCVMAIDVMKIIKTIGEVIDKINVETLSVMIATKFMWIPGVRPVMVPANNPNIIAIISINIVEIYIYFYRLEKLIY
jgi:hypothetical protein